MTLSEIRKKVKNHLGSNDLKAIAELAKKDRRAMSALVRYSYDKGSVESWRAIKAIGMATKAIIDKEYDFVRETVRKLIWSIMEESGAIGWSAPEMLGEISAADPKKLHDIIPIIPSYYDEIFFRAGVMYSMSRLSDEVPDEIKKQKEFVKKSLTDENPLVKVYGLLTAKKLSLAEVSDLVKQLESSGEETEIYDGASFKTVKISEIAKDVSKVLAA